MKSNALNYIMLSAVLVSAVACSKGSGGKSTSQKDENTYFLNQFSKNRYDSDFKSYHEVEVILNAKSGLADIKQKSAAAVVEKNKNYIISYDIEYIETQSLKQGAMYDWKEMYNSGYNKVTKILLLDLPTKDNPKYAIDCNQEKIEVSLTDEGIDIYRRSVDSNGNLVLLDVEEAIQANSEMKKISSDNPFVSEIKKADKSGAQTVDCRTIVDDSQNNSQSVVEDSLTETGMED